MLLNISKNNLCALTKSSTRFEFILPSFRNENKKTLLKIFDLENRKLFYKKLSEFKKQKSIIDDSFFLCCRSKS